MHYRSRIRLRINKDGTMGYFKPKSHTLVPLDYCSIADEPINCRAQRTGNGSFCLKMIEFRSNGQTVVANVSSLKVSDRPKISYKIGQKVTWSEIVSMDTKCGTV